MLVLLGVLGAGPAALLHASHDRVTRVALAPAYGLALGCGLLTTALWKVPGDKLAWLGLLPLCVASLALAAWRTRRGQSPHHDTAGRTDWLQLALVVLVVLVAASRPLGDLGSVGFIGGYQIADSDGYVAEIDGAMQVSIDTAQTYAEPLADRGIAYWAAIANGYQQIGYDAVQASVNPLLGLHASDTQAPFLIVLLAVGALSVFAFVRVLTRSSSWGAVAGGVLAAGPVLLTLVMDGSQGALAGLVLLVPFALAGVVALRTRRWLDVVLAGVLAGGLQAAYPLWIPHVALAALPVLAYVLARRVVGVGALVKGLALLVGVAIVTALYAFTRNVEYWRSIIDGTQSFAGLPVYDVRFGTLPQWVLQTRDFYDRVPFGDAFFSAFLLPAALVALIGVGLWRVRAALVLAGLIVAGAVLAQYVVDAQDCSYCGQRNLLPLAPALMALVGVGVAALRRTPLVLAAGAAVLVVVAVPYSHTSARIADAAYVVDPEVRTALDALQDPAAGVHLEGFGQGDKPKMEEPAVYHVVDERVPGAPSYAAFVDDLGAQQYLGGKRDPGPELRLDRRYVLSRFAEVDHRDRRVVRRAGPIALEERTGRYDVTIEGGVKVSMSNADRRGRAWLAPGVPLVFFVVGGREEPLWLRIGIREVTNVGVRPGKDLDARRRGDGHDLDVCVQTDDVGPGRLASLELDQAPGPPPPKVPKYAAPAVTGAGYVTSVDVVDRDCSPLPKVK